MNYKTTGLALTALGLGLVTQASATNGVNLIGIGPISRALGGTGLAAPQDAVSAVFSNPAAMCLSDACGAPQFDFSLTTFMPRTSAKFTAGGKTFKGDSASDLYFIPALGISLPIGGDGTRWRAGFALYGISGLGVDYEKEPIGAWIPFNFTELQIMKIAPSIAYSVTPDISIGMSAHVNYASLEIGSSVIPGFGKHDNTDWSYGLQLGTTWKISQCLTAGISYTTAQKNTFKGVMPNMTGPGVVDFDLESPQQAGLGVAWVGVDDRLTLSCDVKWLNWSNAAGYSDFGWDDQWTLGLGAQYELIQDKLVARVGYNYGKNPLRRNDSFGDDMASIIGFPAIIEHHAAVGIGYQVNESITLNAAWVHAFENTMKSSVPGMSVESSLSEDTIDLGMTWRF
jgi:long-chain fatty acid transport protein